MTDKMAAMILMVQAAPLYRIKTLHALLNQAAKQGRREALMALETLKDLWMTNLLPDDRKLISFHHRPLSATNITEMHKVYWYYEDVLKSLYAEFVASLAKASHDSIMHSKRKAQHIAFELLRDKPEQEQQLLAILVNKLGDPERKIASNSAHLLNALLQRHRGMKLVVAREVESFLHRSSVSARAQYYGIIFLNQIMLSEDQVDLSKKLLAIYFSMFKRLSDLSAEDTSSKMLSALLTGVNRAFPFAPTDEEGFAEQLDILFKIVHVASFNKAAQALQLIYQVMYAQENLNDRFYRALYQKLGSPELHTSSRQGLFLNVLYKAMKNDKQAARVAAFIKRVLQICHHQSPSFSCGALYLVSEIVRGKKELRKHFEKPVSVPEELLAASKTVLARIQAEMDGLQMDKIASTVASIPGAELGTGKQAGQIVFGGKERISGAKKSTSASAASMNIDESKTSESDANDTKKASETDSTSESLLKKPWHEVKLELYDPMARDPLYAHAEVSGWWELINLSKHFHPSVSKWATMILNDEKIEYSGDPLVDFGLQAFLDRIVYKNPKQLQTGNSNNKHAKKSMIPEGRTIAVNSDSFIARPEEKVPEDQLYFYKYFQTRAEIEKGKKKKDKKKKKSDEDEDSDDDGSEGDFGFNDDDEGEVGSDYSNEDGFGEIDDEEMDVDDYDGGFSDDNLDEHEVEEAVLKGLEKIEGTKLYDRKAMKDEEGKTYSYDDLEDEDFDDDEETGQAMDSFLSTLATEDSDDEDDDNGGHKNGVGSASRKKKGTSTRDNTDFISDDQPKRKKKDKMPKSTFASVDEFQHILETSGIGENKWDKERARKGQNMKKRKAPFGKRDSSSNLKKTRR